MPPDGRVCAIPLVQVVQVGEHLVRVRCRVRGRGRGRETVIEIESRHG